MESKYKTGERKGVKNIECQCRESEVRKSNERVGKENRVRMYDRERESRVIKVDEMGFLLLQNKVS